MIATVSAVAGVSMPAHADAAVDLLNCYQTTTGSVSFSATTMTQGQGVTVSWRTNWPVTCYANASLWLIGEPGLAIDPETGLPNEAAALPLYRHPIYLANSYPAALSGSISLTVPVTSYWTLWFDTGLGNRILAGPVQLTVGAALPVTLPPDRNLYITQSGTAERESFIRAMVTPNAIVNVAGDVNLDLTGVDHIHVAPGVELRGDRTRNPRGPRLFTTSYPELLLMIGDDRSGANGLQSDNVRISDVRMDGGESSDPCQWAGAPGANDAVEVYSSRHVEIDHSEFYRWSGAGVNIHDNFSRINRDSGRDGVWVHDNWFHDNQHPTFCEVFPIGSGHGGGYGVTVAEGGFPLIERNVFNDNRHAIAGHGSTGDGYLVYDNLFLHPGVDSVRAGFTSFNHQIDMHGLETCSDINNEHFNCGQAGEYGDIAYNTVVSDDSDAIQLRGKPTSYYNPVTGVVNPAGGIRVHNNVFAQSVDDALTQTQQGLFDDGGNFYNQQSVTDTFGDHTGSPACDFDGDGISDGFRASGVAWWYYSAFSTVGSSCPGRAYGASHWAMSTATVSVT